MCSCSQKDVCDSYLMLQFSWIESSHYEETTNDKYVHRVISLRKTTVTKLCCAYKGPCLSCKVHWSTQFVTPYDPSYLLPRVFACHLNYRQGSRKLKGLAFLSIIMMRIVASDH